MARRRQKTVAEGPLAVQLDIAYQELSRQAYAVWLRMMIEPESVLEGWGMEKLAARFGYRQRGFFAVVRELRDKGYMRVAAPAKPGEPAALLIGKRPLLIGRDHFVKLS